MGELGRVMEDVALEALDILAQLDGPENGFNPERQFLHPTMSLSPFADLSSCDIDYRDFVGSDAGESIAPFDSASQAMSRASSSASLDEDQQRDLQREQQQNAPPLPTPSRQMNGYQSSSHLRQSTTDSLASPAASRPASHLGGPRSSIAPNSASIATSAPPPPQPIMPPVPTAPRPISTVAYTERHEGLPTFEIPKAPDLSRRPDDSSDEEEEEVRSVTQTDMMNHGVPTKLRSRSYPLDSPGLQTTQQRSGGFMMGSPSKRAPSAKSGGGRRRAMSDSSSIEEGSNRGGRMRKRSGSFFGGIAGLFKRKNKKDRDEDEEDSRDDPAMDYYEGRNRLAGNGGGGGGQQFNSRSDADVMAAVLGAGVRQSNNRRGGGRDDSSDDDEPRNVVKHVNDPKQRIKAMSEVGRASSNVGSTRGALPPSSSSRPVLSRKGTSNSVTGRPMSMIVQPVARPKFVEKKYEAGGSELGGEKKKKTKKVKKAASDIGYSGGNWVSTSQNTNNSVAFPSTTSTSTPVATRPQSHVAPPPVPNVAPVAPAADTSSIKKKKKKSKEPSETIILSAEALGIPSPAAGGPTPVSTAAVASPAFAPSRPPGVSRSNTITSTTSASGPPKIKKKKKSASVAGSIAEEPSSTSSSKPLPTADDLAKTLPTARSSSSAFTTQLPRPDDDPYNSGSTRPLSTVAPSASPPAQASTPTTSLAVKSAKSKLAADEKRNKRHSQLHGEGNWVSLPPSAHPVGQASGHTRNSSNPRSEVHEGDESLLAAVERAGMIDSAKPSRTYTGSKPNSGTTTPTPAKQALSSSASTPAISSSTSQRNGLSASPSAGPAWVSGGLAKRKSVRLADNSNLSVPSPNPHHVPSSPASSVRGTSPPPPKPILVNSPARGTSPNPSSAGGWPTRDSIRASMMDSSDEEDGDGGYMAARRALRKETKSMNEVFGNGGNKVDKGKGKAV